MVKVNKKYFILILIFIVALILRTLAALHTDVGTDELPHAVRAIEIISAGRLSTLDQVPLYLYLTDVGYQLFGINGFTTRITNIIFGSFAVFLVYLIGKELYNKKIGLISSFLFAISSYAIMFNFEPDMLGVFFTTFSILFYIKGLKYDNKYFYYASFMLGLGILAKNISAFIIPVYVLFYFIYDSNKNEKPFFDIKNKRINIDKKLIKTIIISAIIVIVTVSPIIVFNLLLYQDKGITDLIVARSLKLDVQLYEQFFGGLREWSFSPDYQVISQVVRRFFRVDGLLFSLSLLGIIFSLKDLFKKKNLWGLFLLLGILVQFIFLTGSAGASKTHYLYISPMLAIFAAISISKISNYAGSYFKESVNKKKLLLTIFGIILVFNAIMIAETITEPAGILQVRSLAENFEEESLVIADSRIWNGKIAWALNDKHYLESNYFGELMNKMNEFPGEPKVVPVYFVECVNDDCGWGRGLKENVAIQEATESIVNIFSQQGILIGDFPGKKFSFKVYKAEIPIKTSIFQVVDETHQFFMNSVRWENKEKMPDYYETHNFLGKTLDWVAHLVLYISVISAILSLFYLIYLIKNSKS